MILESKDHNLFICLNILNNCLKMLNKTEKKIMELFYKRREQIHLREIAKEAGMNENSAYRTINHLTEEGILKSVRKGNMRVLSIRKGKKTSWILSLFDIERYERLPHIRRTAIETFLSSLSEPPIFAVLFGSTADYTFRPDSDIDILIITNNRIKTKDAEERGEAQSSIKINSFQLIYEDFKNELRKKQEPVIQSALKKGFPLINHIGYHEVINNDEE